MRRECTLEGGGGSLDVDAVGSQSVCSRPRPGGRWRSWEEQEAAARRHQAHKRPESFSIFTIALGEEGKKKRLRRLVLMVVLMVGGWNRPRLQHPGLDLTACASPCFSVGLSVFPFTRLLSDLFIIRTFGLCVRYATDRTLSSDACDSLSALESIRPQQGDRQVRSRIKEPPKSICHNIKTKHTRSSINCR